MPDHEISEVEFKRLSSLIYTASDDAIVHARNAVCTVYQDESGRRLSLFEVMALLAVAFDVGAKFGASRDAASPFMLSVLRSTREYLCSMQGNEEPHEEDRLTVAEIEQAIAAAEGHQ